MKVRRKRKQKHGRSFRLAKRAFPLQFAAAVSSLLLFIAACDREGRHPADANGRAPAPPPTALLLVERVDHLDIVAREPMVVELESGALLVAGYGSQVTGFDPNSPPQLWRSDDRGKSWERVSVGDPRDGAGGNSDVDLAVGPDGTIYFIVMGFNRDTFEGTHIAMGVSHDDAASWEWTRLSQHRFDDRPWVEVAHDGSPAGTAHAIWNDGSGVAHATSTDAGRHWTERPRIHSRGGSSHLAVGPQGEVAVRISPLSASANQFDAEVDLIAVSTDGGATWRKNPAPGDRRWDPTFSDPTMISRWVEPLAWSADGALWSLWSEGAAVWLARSLDYGESWRRWMVKTAEGVAFFPYLAAGPYGRLAATWFEHRGEELRSIVTWIDPARADVLAGPNQGEGSLVLLEAEPFFPDAFLDTGADAEGSALRTPAGEYLPVAFLADGSLAVVSPIQDAGHARMGFSFQRFEPR